jgi:hypothetical protein
MSKKKSFIDTFIESIKARKKEDITAEGARKRRSFIKTASREYETGKKKKRMSRF